MSTLQGLICKESFMAGIILIDPCVEGYSKLLLLFNVFVGKKCPSE